MCMVCSESCRLIHVPLIMDPLLPVCHIPWSTVCHMSTCRYASDQIYTTAGPVLIALNPCKHLPLYTSEVAAAYKGGCSS